MVLSEPHFNLMTDECIAFGASDRSAEHEGAALHLERRLLRGGLRVEWACLEQGKLPENDVML